MLSLRAKAILMTTALLVGCLTATAAECDAADLAIVTTPAPTLYAAELRRHQEHMQAPGGADVLLLGDSLTQRWEPEWTERVFPDQSVAYFGLRSDRIQNMFWRLPQIAEVQQHPTTVVLWIGTNNLMIGDKPCAIAAGMGQLASEVREAWPEAQLLLLGIEPHGAGYRERDRLAVNSQLRQEQFAVGYRYVDIDALACPESAVAVGGNKPPLCNRYRPDNVHLDRLGYDMVSSAVIATGLTQPAS